LLFEEIAQKKFANLKFGLGIVLGLEK